MWLLFVEEYFHVSSNLKTFNYSENPVPASNAVKSNMAANVEIQDLVASELHPVRHIEFDRVENLGTSTWSRFRRNLHTSARTKFKTIYDRFCHVCKFLGYHVAKF